MTVRLTLGRARELARQATRGGYYAPTERRSWVHCPEDTCRARIEVEHRAGTRTGGKVNDLRAGVVEHLRWGDCHAYPEDPTARG